VSLPWPTPDRPAHQRRAYVCPACGAKGSPTRVFLLPDDPIPRCPFHRMKMVRQPNRPYKGSVKT
jgi:hypothetical protein